MDSYAQGYTHRLEETPLHSLLTAEWVTIYVGAEKKKFVVHKELLCDRSDYFKAAFNGNFREAAGSGLHLRDDDTAAFELFITWVYSGMLLSLSLISAKNVGTYFTLLALSEKFLVERLSNQTVDVIRSYYWLTRDPVQAEHVLYVCENVSNLRLQDAMVHYAAHQLLEQNPANIPPSYQEMLMNGGECMVSLVENLLNSANLHSRRACIVMNFELNCAYHTHNTTSQCSGPKFTYDRLSGPKRAQESTVPYNPYGAMQNHINQPVPNPVGNETGALGTGFSA